MVGTGRGDRRGEEGEHGVRALTAARALWTSVAAVLKFIGKDVAKKDGFALDELEVASLNLQRMKNGAGFEAGTGT